jgi:Zn-dependent protease
MEHFFIFSLEQIPFVIIALVIGFTIHEYAHAALAYKFGDPTAKDQGRLTLSPMAHIEPIGALLILIVGFGWARPVPVNSSYFKKPRIAGVIVSLAGPISNLITAFVSVFLWYLLIALGLTNIMSETVHEFFYQLFNFVTYLNVLLFVFNLLPLPPLDGYRIIEELVPRNVRYKMKQFEGYAILIFLLLVLTPLDQYTIQPLLNVIQPIIFGIDYLVSPIIQLGNIT